MQPVEQDGSVSTTNAHICTGDGIGMAMRAGFPVQDMEMWQFYPTGIHGAGTLVLKFVAVKVATQSIKMVSALWSVMHLCKDLAGLDVVARSMVQEILAGRGW